MAARISRSAYAGMYGPTTGDRIRLADTDLIEFICGENEKSDAHLVGK